MPDLFTSLPPEIRHQIYTLALLSPTPLTITSPRRGHPCTVIQRHAANFAALSRTSKLIHSETTPLFYTRNTFVLSHGEYASPHFTNTHALKAFISKNKKALKLIRNVVLELAFERDYFRAFEGNIQGMKTVARQFARHFVSVESVAVEIRWVDFLGRNTYVEQRVIEEEECREELASIVRLVLKTKGLKEVKWLERQRPVFGKLEALLGKVMKERKVPEGERVKVLAVEGEERKEVRCDYWNLMRAQGVLG